MCRQHQAKNTYSRQCTQIQATGKSRMTITTKKDSNVALWTLKISVNAADSEDRAKHVIKGDEHQSV